MAVFQVKDKKKWTKDGRSWFFKVYYIDIDGKTKPKYSKLYLKKSEAKEAEIEFLSKKKKLEDILFKDLTHLYLIEYQKKNKDNTYKDTKNRIEKHILPIFENKMVTKINIADIDKMKEKIQHLDIKTQNSIITYLRAILRLGVEQYDLEIPVLNKIKTIPAGIQPPKKYTVWDTKEFSIFINQVDDILLKALFTLLYFSGMRLGEALALNWNDYRRNIISITKSCNKRGEVTTPKTSNSYRDIDIPNIVIEQLDELYREVSKAYDFNNDMFIFGGIKPLSRATITRAKDYYISKAKVRRITIHELRHSHVSLLREMGYSVKQIATRVGDTEITVLSTYSHLFESNKFAISQGLNNLAVAV